MPLTEQQTRQAATIARDVTRVMTHGGGGAGLLVSMVDHMVPCMQLLALFGPHVPLHVRTC